jgi:hypothetical protein
MTSSDYIEYYSCGRSAAGRNREHRQRMAPHQDRPRRRVKGDSHVVRHLDLTRFRLPWQASRTCSRRPRREPATGAYPAEHTGEPPAGLVSCAGTRTGLAGGDLARLAPAAPAAIAACGIPARSNPAGVSCRIARGTRADLPSGTAGMLRRLSGHGGSRRPLGAASRTRAQQTAGSLPTPYWARDKRSPAQREIPEGRSGISMPQALTPLAGGSSQARRQPRFGQAGPAVIS